MSRASSASDVAYQSLVETMACGALVIDPETTRILYCNGAFSELFLTSPANLVGACLVDLLRPEDRDHVSWLLDQATRQPTNAHVTLMSPAKPLLACMSSAVLPGVSPRALGIVLSPAVALFESQTLAAASRQMEVENALRASENRYSQVVEQAEEGICLLDGSGEIVDANPSLGRILGCTPAQLIGRKIRDVKFLRELEPDRPKLQQEAERRTVIGERRIQRRDGTQRTVEGSAKMLPNGTLLLIIRDISERRLLEKEVLEISRREERRIGRDLYDLLAQQLAGVGFLTKVLEQKLQSKGLEESKDAHRIGELVREAVLQTRNLAEGLCPIEFNADGLTTALRELCRSSGQMSDVRCRFVASDSPVLTDEASATQLYLIAREMLNASKQAGARQVTVRLETVNGRFNLSIEHDGQSRSGEKTLSIVRYRASLIGAELNVRRDAKTVLVRCSLKHVA